MWMGEDESLRLQRFPSWGSRNKGPRRSIADWESLGWRWQRQWSPKDLRGSPMSACGADLGVKRVIPVGNPAGKKAIPCQVGGFR